MVFLPTIYIYIERERERISIKNILISQKKITAKKKKKRS